MPEAPNWKARSNTRLLRSERMPNRHHRLERCRSSYRRGIELGVSGSSPLPRHAVSARFSKSLARHRLRSNQNKVRSTTSDAAGGRSPCCRRSAYGSSPSGAAALIGADPRPAAQRRVEQLLDRGVEGVQIRMEDSGCCCRPGTSPPVLLKNIKRTFRLIVKPCAQSL
jgi:hypothetical protein